MLSGLAAARWPRIRFVARAPAGRLSPDELLVLRGDPSRPTRALRMKAVWEARPENAVYFANYFTALLVESSDAESVTPERIAALEAAVRQGEAVDPGNGRYRLALAAILAGKAAKVDSEAIGRSGSKTLYRSSLEIRDRGMLDRAMAEAQAALAMPVYKRRSDEMLREQLRLLPCDTLPEMVRRIGLAAGLLLPDLSYYRNLCRIALLYSAELAKEGRTEEADRLIGLWHPLAVTLNDDAFTLIDELSADT